MKIYELTLDNGYGYRSLQFSANKQALESFIASIKEYDSNYVDCNDDDEACEAWEYNHPLKSYLPDIEYATDCLSFGEYLFNSDFKSISHSLGIIEHELNDFDPLATLNFYIIEGMDCYNANGKGRHYTIKYDDIDLFWYSEIEGWGEKVGVRFDWDRFKTLEQAQAWCQKDYDVYYKGLSDDG